MRRLTESEQDKIKILTKNQVSLALIEPTETGLKKSIMDATGPVRSFLKANDVHDFDYQLQGPDHKVLVNSKIYTEFKIISSNASLYRPITKKGDPRIWFSGLTKVAVPNDIIAIIFYESELHVFNLTQLDVVSLLNSNINNPLKELVQVISGKESQIALELLGMLRKVASFGPIPSMVDADTSVGRTLETVLGIKINSSKQPDYKGIELKSFRSNKSNRKNLFAQVPDWDLSKLKSSEEILETIGKIKNHELRLYCTVSAITRNTHGLTLRLNSDIKQIIENSDKPEVGDFVVWTLEKLHARLQEKHRETFWVAADSTLVAGREHFQYTLVEHTKKPIVSQFDLLVEQGIITLDHLIKRKTNGSVVEKGPLFKIKPSGIGLLFPPSEKYNLV